MAIKLYQEYLGIDVSSAKTKTFYTNITNNIQNVITRSDFQAGIVLVHTLHTTAGLTNSQNGNRESTGFLVQEDEPLLMEDLKSALDSGAKKFLGLLPLMLKNRKRLLDVLPENVVDFALEWAMSLLKPAGGYQHDDFEKRVVNMGPNERKNAEAHLKAAMIKESVFWTFSHGQLGLGKWQSILFWDFDPIGRKKRKLSIVLIGE